MTNRVALTNGEWVMKGGIARWQPNPRHHLCGTNSGYYHHRRQHQEPACDDCRFAHAQASYKAKARRALFKAHPPRWMEDDSVSA